MGNLNYGGNMGQLIFISSVTSDLWLISTWGMFQSKPPNLGPELHHNPQL